MNFDVTICPVLGLPKGDGKKTYHLTIKLSYKIGLLVTIRLRCKNLTHSIKLSCVSRALILVFVSGWHYSLQTDNIDRSATWVNHSVSAGKPSLGLREGDTDTAGCMPNFSGRVAAGCEPDFSEEIFAGCGVRPWDSRRV